MIRKTEKLDHPSLETLEAYLNEELAEADWVGVAGHIGICSACTERARHLERASDLVEGWTAERHGLAHTRGDEETWDRRLRAVQHAAQTAAEALVPHLKQWLEGLMGPTPTSILQPVYRGGAQTSVPPEEALEPVHFQQTGNSVAVTVHAGFAPAGGIVVLVPQGDAQELAWDSIEACWRAEFNGVSSPADEVAFVPHSHQD